VVLYYEIVHENPLNPDEDMYQFVMSSDGRTNTIWFYDKTEKVTFNFISSLFKEINLSNREYDVATFITTLLGIQGKRILAVINSIYVGGGLKYLKIKQIIKLEEKVKNKTPLNWVEPPPKPEPKAQGQVEIKFKEEEFFYKPSASIGELSGEALWNALALKLNEEVIWVKSASNDELKKVYRRKAMELHPDRNNGNGAAMAELNYLYQLYTKSLTPA